VAAERLILGLQQTILLSAKTDIPIDERARDGTWCTLPYPNHKKGCPNFGKSEKCPPYARNYEDIVDLEAPVYMIINRFNLGAHEAMMKAKHPKWSRKQCRNVLYWQNTVRKHLKLMAYDLKTYLDGYEVLEIPEAHGVNVYKLMHDHAITLTTDPDIVYKSMLVVKFND